MLISLLINNPILGLAWLIVILMALTVHEFSHAAMAHFKGDDTAEKLGRLTLNPFAHIDPIGLIPLLFFGFGWAKPVPINPYHFQNPRRDSLHVALAGPASNLLLAAICGVTYRLVTSTGADVGTLPFLLLVGTIINLMLMFFNLIPIFPLDGSRILDVLLVKPEQQKFLLALKKYGPQALMILVLISLLTHIDAFFFISIPAQIACYGLTGKVCLAAIGAAM